MSRERAERLAAALGVTVEVVRPKPRALWRVYLDGAPASGKRYGSGYHEAASAWTAASQALQHRAECACGVLRARTITARYAAVARKRVEATVEERRRALGEAEKGLREAEENERAARAEMDAALAAATPEARAAFAALTEGP